MAQDAAGSLKYYLCIDLERKDDLDRIRTWHNLKVGQEDNSLWIKDLEYAQIHSVEVKSLPFKKVFYEENNKLFLINSRLPERTVPALLWTPIDRALPVQLPSFNHNYFGVHDRISIRLVQTESEVEGVAMVTTLSLLERYVETAPAIRLQAIRWAILDQNKALLFGKPLLPLPGDVFWQRKDLLLPAGYDLEFHLLTDFVQKSVNPGREHWVLWSSEGLYALIPKDELLPLSRSSFRQSTQPFLNEVQ
jgi:hypothetical protein